MIKQQQKRVCEYKNCTKWKRAHTNYCQRHRNGTDPDEDYKEIKIDLPNLEIRKIQKTTTYKGDEIEEYVYEIIKSFEDIEYLEKIGQTCSYIDIIYKYNNEEMYRGLQVKRLTLNKNRKDSYYCRLNDKYNDDTLLGF